MIDDAWQIARVRYHSTMRQDEPTMNGHDSGTPRNSPAAGTQPRLSTNCSDLFVQSMNSFAHSGYQYFWGVKARTMSVANTGLI